MNGETAGSERSYRFGEYVLDVAGRELRCSGEPVVTQPRVFDLLVYLVEHRDRAVDKNELQDKIWPGMIVTETALTRAVMKARRAVGDDADSQAVIKTLHRHGYRFVAELQAQEPEPEVEATVAEPVGASESKVAAEPLIDTRRRWLATAVVAVVALVGYLVLWPPFKANVSAKVAVLPLINATGQSDVDWARLGLMSLVSGLIANEGELSVVPDVNVLKLTERFAGIADDEQRDGLIERLRRAYGATHVVSMRLEDNPGGFLMRYSVLAVDGKEKEYETVSEEPTALANGVARAIYEVVAGRRRMVGDVPAISDDAFVNEAFARGKSLSLQGQCPEALPMFKVAMTQSELYQPRYEYAVCSDLAGDAEEAEQVLKELIAERRQSGPSRSLAESLKAAGALYTRTGRPDEAKAMLHEALEVAEAIDDHDRTGDILVNLAIAAKNRSEFDLASDLLGRAMLAYERGDRDPPGSLHQTQANLSMNRGELAEAETHLKAGLDAFRYVGNRRREAMMLNNTGFLLRKQGRLEEAEGFHLQSLAIREEIGDRVGVGRIHSMLSVLYSEKGRLEDAKTSAETALEIARDTKDRLFEATSLAQLA